MRTAKGAHRAAAEEDKLAAGAVHDKGGLQAARRDGRAARGLHAAYGARGQVHGPKVGEGRGRRGRVRGTAKQVQRVADLGERGDRRDHPCPISGVGRCIQGALAP